MTKAEVQEQIEIARKQRDLLRKEFDKLRAAGDEEQEGTLCLIGLALLGANLIASSLSIITEVDSEEDIKIYIRCLLDSSDLLHTQAGLVKKNFINDHYQFQPF